MGISEILDKIAMKRNKYKEMEEDNQLHNKLIERQKTANERELERFREENRQKIIKQELEKWRKHRQHEIEFGHNMINTKNMFAHQSTLLKQPALFTGEHWRHNEKRLFFA